MNTDPIIILLLEVRFILRTTLQSPDWEVQPITAFPARTELALVCMLLFPSLHFLRRQAQVTSPHCENKASSYHCEIVNLPETTVSFYCLATSDDWPSFNYFCLVRTRRTLMYVKNQCPMGPRLDKFRRLRELYRFVTPSSSSRFWKGTILRG